MSYRRDELSRLPEFSTVMHLERYIRNMVIANSAFCFIPQSVTRLSRLLREDFMLAERDTGYAGAFRAGSGSGFWPTLADAVGALRHGRVALACAILLAGAARWFGRVQARSTRLMHNVSDPS